MLPSNGDSSAGMFTNNMPNSKPTTMIANVHAIITPTIKTSRACKASFSNLASVRGDILTWPFYCFGFIDRVVVCFGDCAC
jgi:hypothetical protein